MPLLSPRQLLWGSCLLVLVTVPAEAREWVDVTGKHKVEAEFVRLEDGLVYLKKANGKLLKPIPLEKLSAADRKFAEEAAAAAATDTPDTATTGDEPAASPMPADESAPTEAPAALTPPTGPQALAWKFTAGQQLPYQSRVQMQMDTMLQQRPFKLAMDLTQSLRWTVKEIDSMGVVTVACQIERIVGEVTPPQGQKVTVDTAEPPGQQNRGLTGAAMMAPLKQLLGPAFVFKLNPQGKVLETKLPDTIKPAANAAAGPMAAGGALSDPEQIAVLLASQLSFLPPSPVGVGGKWSRPLDIPTTAGGRLKGLAHYELVGWEERGGRLVAKIVETDKVEFVPAPPPANAPATAGQPAPTFTAEEMTTTYYFDPAAGALVESGGTALQNLEWAYSPTVKTTVKLKLETEMRQGDGSPPSSAEPASAEPAAAETPPAGAGS